jgi:hypothetical protein
LDAIGEGADHHGARHARLFSLQHDFSLAQRIAFGADDAAFDTAATGTIDRPGGRGLRGERDGEKREESAETHAD